MWYLNFIINQSGVPAFKSGLFAQRPAPGYVGRLYISTDTFEIFRDTGSAWDLIGGPGSGSITGSLTANRVAYATGTNTIATSANLLFDGTTLTAANDIVVNGARIGNGGGGIDTNVLFGTNSLQNNTTGFSNVAIGTTVLTSNTTGSGNVAIGLNVLRNNTDGGTNIAIGFGTMEIANGTSGHIAIGQNVMRAISGASGNNVGIGNNALFLASICSQNTAVGHSALKGNSTGFANTAVGSICLEACNGTENVGMGYFTLAGTTSGSYNAAFGTRAFGANTTGNYNIAIGYQAGLGGTNLENPATGDKNIHIGSNTKSTGTANTREIVIGHDLTGNGSNTVTIGGSGTVANYFTGQVRANTFLANKTASGIAVDITDSANGNAVNINKTGSGFAINIAAGDVQFRETRILNNCVVDSICSAFAFSGRSIDLGVPANNTTEIAISDNEGLDRDSFIGMAFGGLFLQNNVNFVSPSYGFGNPALPSCLISLANGQVAIQTAIASVNPSTKFLVTVPGNILINSLTDDLTNKLQVTGNGIFQGSGTTQIRIKGNSVTGTDFQNDITGTYIYNRDATPIYFGTNNTLRLTIDGSTGAADFVSSIKTGAPTTGTAAAWKLGSYVAVAAPAPTGYIEIDIAGTLYKIAAGT